MPGPGRYGNKRPKYPPSKGFVIPIQADINLAKRRKRRKKINNALRGK